MRIFVAVEGALLAQDESGAVCPHAAVSPRGADQGAAAGATAAGDRASHLPRKEFLHARCTGRRRPPFFWCLAIYFFLFDMLFFFFCERASQFVLVSTARF